MKLGDLDALKERNTVIGIVNGEKMKVVPVKAIDNAPTVEISQEQAIDKLNETGWLYNHDKAIAEFVRPKGDLISREALTRAIKTECNPYGKPTIDYKSGLMVLKIIDNAPTVEPFEPDYVGAERLKARQRGYEEGYHNGMEIGKTLNPKIKHGEWISTTLLGQYCLECDQCKRVDFGIKYYNFCPNCGADMQKGGAE